MCFCFLNAVGGKRRFTQISRYQTNRTCNYTSEILGYICAAVRLPSLSLSIYDSKAVAFLNCIMIFNFIFQLFAAEITAYCFAISLPITWQEDAIWNTPQFPVIWNLKKLVVQIPFLVTINWVYKCLSLTERLIVFHLWPYLIKIFLGLSFHGCMTHRFSLCVDYGHEVSYSFRFCLEAVRLVLLWRKLESTDSVTITHSPVAYVLQVFPFTRLHLRQKSSNLIEIWVVSGGVWPVVLV